MSFYDKTQLMVQSGRGGAGCISFRRERFIPKGGPDGGSGGHGGDVVLRTSSKKETLRHLKFKDCFRAGNGKEGQGSKKTGKAGEDLVIELPIGTVVSDSSTGLVLGDLVADSAFLVVAKGGKGGRGNITFKSSTNRVPRVSELGEPGCSVLLDLELKSLSDVGMVGLPNAGKSTLLSVISSTKPKIGNYPFTTVVPNFGVVDFDYKPFVVADIPSLIEGAHCGSGLGNGFLRHIERAAVLIHILDASQIDPSNPLVAIKIVDKELALYNERLLAKPRIFVLSKTDIPSTHEVVKLFKRRRVFRKYNFMYISSVTGEGIRAFILRLYEELNKCYL